MKAKKFEVATLNFFIFRRIRPSIRPLMFDFKKGLDPLCKFLGYPVPDVPFPHKNVKGSKVRKMVSTDPHPLFRRTDNEIKIAKLLLAALSALPFYWLPLSVGFRSFVQWTFRFNLWILKLFAVEIISRTNLILSLEHLVWSVLSLNNKCYTQQQISL